MILIATRCDGHRIVSGDNSEEGQVVDDARYALRALRNCFQLKTNAPEVA